MIMIVKKKNHPLNVTKVPVLIVLTKVADRLYQMAVTQSMGKIVDCDINAKFYVQSFNIPKWYLMYKIIARCLFA